MPSDLPIIRPDPPPRTRSTAEKYGGLHTLGLVGLAVLLSLLAWFGWGLWTMRGVFRDIYILNDPQRPESDRIRAAVRLARDPKFTDEQAWETVIRRELPLPARYVVAESLTSEIVRSRPRAFTLAVARSTGWPSWLRTLAIRPIAYAADDGLSLPSDILAELPCDRTPAGLWATYARVARGSNPPLPCGRDNLEQAAASQDATAELAGLLVAALEANGPRRDAWLDRATRWMRSGVPEFRSIGDVAFPESRERASPIPGGDSDGPGSDRRL